jgi:hypothetical protein
MHQGLANLEIKTLEAMYLREIEILKFKLLSGAFWKDIKKQKDKAIELALVIYKKQHGNDTVPDNNFSMEELNA